MDLVPALEECVSELGYELNGSIFLNAEDAEVFAEVRKGRFSSACSAKNSATSAVRIGSGNQMLLVLTRPLNR